MHIALASSATNSTGVSARELKKHHTVESGSVGGSVTLVRYPMIELRPYQNPIPIFDRTCPISSSVTVHMFYSSFICDLAGAADEN